MTAASPDPFRWDYLIRSDKAQYDSAVPFLSTCHLLAARSTTVVDVGCGRGAPADDARAPVMHDLRGPGRTVIGIDVDPVGRDNPLLDDFALIPPDGRWPLDDRAVDLVVSDFTLEHVDQPHAFVRELARVLRPGGVFVARTVSRNSILASIARRVPNSRHARILSAFQPRRPAQDVFPTCYAMNSRAAVAALFSADFEWSLTYRGGLDQYLLRYPRLARLVVRWERLLPRAVQTTMIVIARRPLSPRAAGPTDR